MFLAKKFGSSIHASVRRYAEHSNKRCALLILEKLDIPSSSDLGLRNYFQSRKFTRDFGTIEFPNVFDIKWPFVQDYIMRKKFHDTGIITIVTEDGDNDFEYHFFNNTYNVFVFLSPRGEKNRTRTKIYLKGHDE
jgi:hypothetical protein